MKSPCPSLQALVGHDGPRKGDIRAGQCLLPSPRASHHRFSPQWSHRGGISVYTNITQVEKAPEKANPEAWKLNYVSPKVRRRDKQSWLIRAPSLSFFLGPMGLPALSSGCLSFLPSHPIISSSPFSSSPPSHPCLAPLPMH